ncbi:MAG TPA: hypothetical protein GXZ66_07800 [Clostridiaceae bacterium]|jgi:hypothetical protein|nr:hypothetical protein [Clostridiaceae bacterium]
MKKVLKDSNQYIKDSIVDYGDFKLFLDLDNGFSKNNLIPPKQGSEHIIKKAEEYLNHPYPQQTASMYMEFKKNGNRTNYEKPYFKRRDMLFYFLLAECIERKGRFTDNLIDLLWMILEESTWVLPAHNGHMPHSSYICPLPYCFKDEVDYIDLFAAETGALLAWVYYLAEEILNSITPVIASRLLYELDRRIINPFLINDDMWWTSLKGNAVNNWNPWIVSNALVVCALCVKDTNKRGVFVERACRMLDGFTKHYPDDGGCDEGPSYWNVAGASYFDCLELIYDMTGGRIDVFSNPFVRRIMEYIMHMHVVDNFYLNFADSPAKITVDFSAVARMGRRTKSNDLEAFGLAQYNLTKPCIISQRTYRSIKSLYDVPQKQGAEYTAKDAALPQLGVMVLRSDKSLLGIKGGHNAEGHNHNDVGNFIVFANSNPLIIDVGVGTYTKETFSSQRYSIWTMRSEYHNLPNIAGHEQIAGFAKRATNCVFDLHNRTFRAELKETYGFEKLVSYTREARMYEDGCIEIIEDIKMEEKSDVNFHLMTIDRPKIGENCLIFENGKVEFDKSLEVFVEQIEMNDEKLSGVWKTNSVFRIHLKAKDIKEGIYHFNIFPQ